MTIFDIDTSTKEGQLLLVAIAELKCGSRKPVSGIFEDLVYIQQNEELYKDVVNGMLAPKIP